jgi:Putative Ig domain
MLGALLADFPGGSSNVLKDPALAAATPSPSPSIISSDYASALPNWLLVALLSVVTLVIVAGFALTAYSLSAPRSTLKNIIGRGSTTRPWNIWDLFGRRPSQGSGPAPNKAEPTLSPPEGTVTAQLVKSLATSARSGRRTTRTTLAIVGFSLLGVVIIGIFGLSGQGVRDLRGQVIAAVTTLVATIAGFYFGAETAQNQGSQAGPTGSAPVFKHDPKDPGFVVGYPGIYTPILTGTPAPTVSLIQGTLPAGLQMDSHTGVISGTPAPGTAGAYTVTLTAKNGISPDVTLPLTLTVAVPSAPGLQPDPSDPGFTVGQAGTYTPILTGAPAPTVSLSPGPLPAGLQLNPATGVISGTPAPGTAGPYTVTLTAHNGVGQDATISVTFTVAEG